MAVKDLTGRPLLFVNSDPSEGGAVPHRRAIYQHVQLKYAKWKRDEKKQRTRASNFPASPQNGDYSARSPTHSSHNGSEVSDEHRADEESGTRSKPNIGKPRPSYRYAQGPTTILREGNSDPFSALAVPVSPNTNALMEYTRDYYLPGIQRDVNNPGQRIVGPEWAQCIIFLQDEGLAYSHFARIAAIIASDPKQSDVSGDFHAQALLFKSKSMSMLKQKLIEDPGNPKTYNHILLLMNAEIFDRNFPAAIAHAKILANLLQDGTIRDDYAFLFKVVYHDAQRAAMSLSKTVLDLDWVADQLIPMDLLIPANHPSAIWMGSMGLGLDSSLDVNPSLKDTLRIFKHDCLSVLLGLKDKSYTDRKVLFYGRFYMTLVMGRLVDHYIDSITLLNEQSSNWLVENNPINEARMSAFMSLAMLLMLRCLTRIDSVKISGNITLFSANMLLLHRLKETLMVVEGQPRMEVSNDFANARLYALFIGAWLEQARVSTQTAAGRHSFDSVTDYASSGAQFGWFNCEFAEQARAMKLYKWTEVREILQQFIYADVMEPNGALWFPWTIKNCQSHAF